MTDTCCQFDGLIARAAQLTTEEAAALGAHLAGCTSCRELARAVKPVTEDVAFAADDKPAGTQTARRDPLEVTSGRYRITGEVGRGGIGRVLHALDQVLDRPVALKELFLDSDGMRRRFLREALITARLQHPSIVPVYDAGNLGAHSPFYAMKLVAGRPLDEAIADAKTLAQRLALLSSVLAVADAMAYAHNQRVIHRDLKPTNVLVGNYGETIVIDWGLAKDLAVDDQDALDAGPYRASSVEQTAAGAVLGTPAYMAPEQAAGEQVDERADVYALGAILYHVVSGAIPHEGATFEEMVHRVISGDVRLLAERAPDVPRDLAAIVTKAMALAQADRYANAQGFAEDLRRFSSGQLVASHAYGTRELVWRWLKRHRPAVMVALAAVAIVGVVGVVSIVRIVRAGQAANEAAARADEAAARARTQLDLGHIERGRQLLWDGYPFQAAPYLAGAYSDGVEHRPLRILLALAARSLPYVEIEAGHELDRLAFSPDGASVLARDRDGQERAWDLRTGHVRPVPARPPSPAEIATIDGGSVLVHDPASGRVRCVLSRWRAGAEHAGAHETIALSGSPEHVELDVADDDGGRLVTTSRSVGDDTVFLTPGRVSAAAQVWDGARCTLLYTLVPEHGRYAVHSASFSGDGTRLVTTSEDTVQIWSLADGSSIAVLRGHQGAVHAAMLSDDGSLALTGGEDRTARLWDAATGRQLAALEGHKAAVVLVALSPDGTRAATATAAGTIRIWSAAHSLLIAERRACMDDATDDGGCYSSEPQPDPQLAVESALFPGQKGMVRNLGWSADRTLAVTASEDRTAWLWDAQRHRPLASFDHPDSVLRGRFEDSGRTLVTSTWDHAWTWDLPFEDRSPAAFARLLECYVPFTLKDEQLEPAPTSRCAHTFDDLPPVRGESRRGADALLAAGDAALRRRAFADAALDYEQAQKLDPREASSKRLAAATALQARAPSSPQVLFDAARTAFRDIHDPRAAFDLLSRAPPGDPAAALLRLELLLAMDRLDEVVAGAARARLDERDELRAIALDFVTWAALKLSGRSPRDERAAAGRLLRSARNHVELVPPAARTDLAALEYALDHGHHRHDEALAVGDVMRLVYLTPGDENFIELATLLGLDWLER